MRLILLILGIVGFVFAESFDLSVAGYDNYFRREDDAVQVLLTEESSDSDVKRLIAAFPRGNSGALAYFLNANDSMATFDGPQHPEGPLEMKVESDSLKVMNGNLTGNGQAGVEGILSLNGNASLGVTILGGVRTLRDYTEGDGLMHSIFNYTLGDYNNTSVTFTKKWINGTNFMNLTFYSEKDVKLQIKPSDNDTLPPVCNFVVGGSSPAKLGFKVVFTETGVGEGIDPDELFLNDAKINETLATQFSFLTHTAKFFAGGWRFYTYFARDTMFALRLIMPILNSEPIEDAFASVLERLYVNGTNAPPIDPVRPGEVCHEETIGDYASFVNIQNNVSSKGNSPVYTYSMVDTSFLLLPSMSYYFLELNQGKGRAEQFLEKKASLESTSGQSYKSLLDLNIDFVLEASKPFVEHPSAENLLHLKYSEPVGNWRDSETGLGDGTIPFDVNTALVPGCLRAIESLSKASIVDKKYEETARKYAEAWEKKALGYFEIDAKKQTLEHRIQNYTEAYKLPSSLLHGNGAFNETSYKICNAKGSGWLNQSGEDHTFYALSLFNDSTPVEVLHSDLGLTLLYADNLPEKFMVAVSDALQPFPRGLTTPIGMVVANPALDSNTSNHATFDRTQYHGTVIWGWQMGIMADGLLRQLSLCDINLSNTPQARSSNSDKPSWCQNKQLIGSLLAGLDRLWQGVEGAKENLYSEVWSYTYQDSSHRSINSTGLASEDSHGFIVTDLGAISPTGTETNAIQLWSYGFLALSDPRLNNSTCSSGTPNQPTPITENATTRKQVSIALSLLLVVSALLV
ncbi:hypothetical protein TRICI_000056 [Trichomonascus ciferrii]|uniref:Uncharacterized protein n=1 Tax=Trichomonascus ciferrii TaxID=44093 RepID=A0A642VED5_9ASCO|nr:hypothetical protein TRICI_000056 [Trichomonascus ciferrii]